MADLACPECGERYPGGPDEPWRCRCGHPLELDASPRPAGPPPGDGQLARDRGLWAFESFLPVDPEVTLGEGWTPIVDAPGWEATFKLEYVFPSGSFKDRGAATTLSRAATLGVDRVVEDSSGNAGAAIAQYAARAGIDAEIYVPADATESKLRAIRRAGAAVVPVEGSREDVSAACRDRADDPGVWYASHAWNPAFLAGTSTFAFEVAAQRDWSAPDAVVLPLGHGTLFLGAHRGFRALREAGWIEGVPRLLGAQAAGYAPVADALREAGNHRRAPSGEANDLAGGVHIREPVREAEIREAIESTGGDAIAIGEEATEAALDRLHRAGFYVESTSALAPAALDAFRDRGVVGRSEDVVVALTGSGLKR